MFPSLSPLPLIIPRSHFKVQTMADHEGKSHVSIVVAGHVDAGKSSLTGRLLYDLGGINDRDMEKLRKIAEENGKPSFAFAYFMDKGYNTTSTSTASKRGYRRSRGSLLLLCQYQRDNKNQ